MYPHHSALIPASLSPRYRVGQLTLQRHFFPRLLKRLHRQVVRRLPEVVAVHRQDRVPHPEGSALVRGESREDFGDENGHPVLSPPLDTDPQPARLLFDNPDFPHRFGGALQTDGEVALSRPEAGPWTPVARPGAPEVRVGAVVWVLSRAVHIVVAVVLPATGTRASGAAATTPTRMTLVQKLVLTAARDPHTGSRVVSVGDAVSQARRSAVIVPVVAPLPAHVRLGRQSQRFSGKFGGHSDPAVAEQKVQLTVFVRSGPNCHSWGGNSLLPPRRAAFTLNSSPTFFPLFHGAPKKRLLARVDTPTACTSKRGTNFWTPPPLKKKKITERRGKKKSKWR